MNKFTFVIEKTRIFILMDNITKYIFRILMNRMRNRIEPEVAKEQYGFVKETRKRNATFMMKRISESNKNPKAHIPMFHRQCKKIDMYDAILWVKKLKTLSFTFMLLYFKKKISTIQFFDFFFFSNSIVFVWKITNTSHVALLASSTFTKLARLSEMPVL